MLCLMGAFNSSKLISMFASKMQEYFSDIYILNL